MQRGFRHFRGTPAAGLHDVFDARGIAEQLRAGVPDRRQLFDYPVGDQFLAIDAADGGGSAILIDLLLDRLRRIDLVKLVDRTDVGIAGIGPADARRIGHHGLELLANDRFCIRQVDRVVVALAHFPAVGAEHFGKFGEMLFRLREDRGLVEVVEAPCEFPCEFEMRQLVFPDRHEIGLVQQDVGRL